MDPTIHLDGTHVAEAYRAFGAREARGVSPTYESWALGVSEDPIVAELLASLSRSKRQPNLVFAAARWHGATGCLRRLPDDPARAVAAGPHDDPRSRHPDQRGEPLRGAPALPRGAAPNRSLCWRSAPPQGCASCPTGTPTATTTAPPSTPTTAPRTWSSPARSDRESLHLAGCLRSSGGPASTSRLSIWMTTTHAHGSRRWSGRSTTTAAHAYERRWMSPAATRRAWCAGDLLDVLPDLAAEAPADATLVVFHSAVLAYLDAEARSAFVDSVSTLPGHWISNEGAQVLPATAHLASAQRRPRLPRGGRRRRPRLRRPTRTRPDRARRLSACESVGVNDSPPDRALPPPPRTRHAGAHTGRSVAHREES